MLSRFVDFNMRFHGELQSEAYLMPRNQALLNVGDRFIATDFEGMSLTAKAERTFDGRWLAVIVDDDPDS